jgi:hypothetical protein
MAIADRSPPGAQLGFSLRRRDVDSLFMNEQRNENHRRQDGQAANQKAPGLQSMFAEPAADKSGQNRTAVHCGPLNRLQLTRDT